MRASAVTAHAEYQQRGNSLTWCREYRPRAKPRLLLPLIRRQLRSDETRPARFSPSSFSLPTCCGIRASMYTTDLSHPLRMFSPPAVVSTLERIFVGHAPGRGRKNGEGDFSGNLCVRYTYVYLPPPTQTKPRVSLASGRGPQTRVAYLPAALTSPSSKTPLFPFSPFLRTSPSLVLHRREISTSGHVGLSH